ncbi:gghA, partial [Symbiodinium sp. KB8]
MRCLAACLVAAAGALLAAAAPNNRPVVGILTLPNHYTDVSTKPAYFPASYVKWIEAGGAQVVPLRHDIDEDSFRAALKNINGVLFTGGGADFTFPNGTLTQYARKGQIVFDEVVSAYKAGEIFPLWGTCLGFEMVNFLGGGAVPGVLVSGFNAENYTLAQSEGLLDVLTGQAVTMNAHHSGVEPAAFKANADLSDNFYMWSTNEDRNGRPFVSTVEGKEWPITATQWHPEKPVFEWDPREVMDHSFDSVRANLLTAQYFIGQTHANHRSFPSLADEYAALIYNYQPQFTQES